jgi:GcrA cell cycle regulator
MSTWTDGEIDTLVNLWPTQSAAQIAKRLQRPRQAVCAEAHRLREEGLLPPDVAKFEIDPRTPRRPARPKPPPPPPPPAIDDTLAMRPCSISELDDSRCHWPLGDVYKGVTMFCGGKTVRGDHYCGHHLRLARM